MELNANLNCSALNHLVHLFGVTCIINDDYFLSMRPTQEKIKRKWQFLGLASVAFVSAWAGGKSLLKGKEPPRVLTLT